MNFKYDLGQVVRVRSVLNTNISAIPHLLGKKAI